MLERAIIRKTRTTKLRGNGWFQEHIRVQFK